METIANNELLNLLIDAAANLVSFETVVKDSRFLDDLWRCDNFIL